MGLALSKQQFPSFDSPKPFVMRTRIFREQKQRHLRCCDRKLDSKVKNCCFPMHFSLMSTRDVTDRRPRQRL